MKSHRDPFDEFLEKYKPGSGFVGHMTSPIGGLSKTELTSRFNSSMVEYLRELAAVAASWLQVPVSNLLQQIDEITTLEELTINGHTWSPDNGARFKIEINTGLAMFCTRVAEVFVANIGSIDANGKRSGTNLITGPTAARKIKRLIATYAAGQEYYEYSSPLLDKELTLFTSKLQEGIINFVLGHELGHILVSTSEKGRNIYQRTIRLLMEQPLFRSGHLGNAQALADEWAKELAADFISTILVTGDELPAHYFAIDLFFIICDLLENEKEPISPSDILEAFEHTGQHWPSLEAFVKENNQFLGTHPPASTRRNFLFEMREDTGVNRQSWGKEADLLHQEILRLPF